jgi:hypothetical protein
LLIWQAGTIMGMYTDWGNLKIVSCGAWLEGRTRQLNMYRGMDALGASIFSLRSVNARMAVRASGAECRAARANWVMPKSSGILVSAFDSEAAGEFA